MEQPVIVFDLGGVLIDWDPRHLYRKLIQDEAEMNRFLSEVCTPAWNAQQDAGRLWADAVAQLVASHPDKAALIEAYHLRWEEMLGGPIHGTVEILEELHDAGFDLYALTNWSAETFPIAQQRYQFLRLFKRILVSGEERIMKPDAQIFRLLLERIGCHPELCVFIDDSPTNIAQANALGFDAILFKGPSALRQALIDRGVLLAS